MGLAENNEISGIIEQNNLKVIFHGENHHFTFMPVLEDYSNLGYFHAGVLHPESNYIKGRLFSNQVILIYCDKDLTLEPTCSINTWLYIISDGNVSPDGLEQFDSIGFEGGSLNSVFTKYSVKISHDDKGTLARFPSDEHCYQLDDGISIRVRSHVSGKESVFQGSSILTSDTKLDLESCETKSTRSDFVTEFHALCNMLQFMTFRKNVYFDEVSLKINRKMNGDIVSCKVGTCHIKLEYEQEEPRDGKGCILLNALSESSVAKLFKFANSLDKKKHEISLAFLPESSKAAKQLTVQQLRDTCTAIELECGLSKIKAEKYESLQRLVKEVSAVIKQSKEWEDPLTEKEYNYINGNISHWSGPAAELAKLLYDKHAEELAPLLKKYKVKEVTEEDIQGVIKIRNQSTHEGSFSSQEKDGSITMILMGTVYASVLERCGVDKHAASFYFEMGLI